MGSLARWFVIALLVGVPGGWSATCCAASADYSGLQLEIQLASPSVVLGEPVIVSLKLTNRGATPVTSSYRLIPGLMISQDGKSFSPYDPHPFMGSVVAIQPRPPELLNPGQAKSVQVQVLYVPSLLFSSAEPRAAAAGAESLSWEERALRAYYGPSTKHLAFPRPGKYYLKARYGSVESEVATLSVAYPKGGDARAWEELKSTPYAVCIQSPHWSLRATDVVAFSDFLVRYPNTVYSRPLARALISYLEHPPGGKPLSSEERDLLTTLKRRYGEPRRLD